MFLEFLILNYLIRSNLGRRSPLSINTKWVTVCSFRYQIKFDKLISILNQKLGIGGHTDLRKLKIPHYTEYQVTKENTPELVAFRERLAREGLKDPWMRNYVFMFDRRYNSMFI